MHQPVIDLSAVVRMPLFFVISGLLSTPPLRRSWRSGLSARICVVWLAITTLVVRVSARSAGARRASRVS